MSDENKELMQIPPAVFAKFVADLSGKLIHATVDACAKVAEQEDGCRAAESRRAASFRALHITKLW